MASELPPSLKPIAHLLSVGNDYSNRDVIIYYWCLYRAVQEGMKLDKSSPGALNFLTTTLSILEKIKKENPGVDALTNDVVAQAHIEDQAQRLLSYAESQDSAGIFNVKVVKSFYSSGFLFDVLSVFGEPDENIQSAKKYAKWRSTYIHNCLKNGETPIPGNKMSQDSDSNTTTNESNSVAGMTAGMKNLNFGNESTGFGVSSQSTSIGFPQSYQPSPSETNTGMSGNYNNYNSSATANDYTGHTAYSTGIANYHGEVGARHSQMPPPQMPSSQLPSQPDPSHVEPAGALTMEELTQAKKFTKFALSALDYDDAKTAILNMHKALTILQK